MNILLQEVYAVLLWSLLYGLAACIVAALLAALVVRLLIALGGLRRANAQWQQLARALHALFWIGLAGILGASMGLLRGIEVTALAAAERQQPHLEALVEQQWQQYRHLLDEPAEMLEAQREQWAEVLEQAEGMDGWLSAQLLSRLDAWLLQAMQQASTEGDRIGQWLDTPVASLRAQWHLSFFALYLGILTMLAPLLLLPLFEWLLAMFLGRRDGGNPPPTERPMSGEQSRASLPGPVQPQHLDPSQAKD